MWSNARKLSLPEGAVTRYTFLRRMWMTANIVGLSALALSFVAPAAADQMDEAYIAALQKHNVVYPDRGVAIATGHMVCDELHQGQTPMRLVLQLSANSQLSAHLASYVIGAAVSAYCPQYRSTID